VKKVIDRIENLTIKVTDLKKVVPFYERDFYWFHSEKAVDLRVF
jgi:predicted enzyme related to lactoylglutathione lyase